MKKNWFYMGRLGMILEETYILKKRLKTDKFITENKRYVAYFPVGRYYATTKRVFIKAKDMRRKYVDILLTKRSKWFKDIRVAKMRVEKNE